MALSDARLRANRENAQRSTGPRTPEGKERSRRNALKHGLAGLGAVMLPEDEEIYQERLREWIISLQPRDAVEDYLVSRAVVRSVQLDRGTRIENAYLVERIAQADTQFLADRLELLERTEAKLRQFGRLGRALKHRGWLEYDEFQLLARLLGPFPEGDTRAADLLALAEEAAPPFPPGQSPPSTLPPQLLALHTPPPLPPVPPETRADLARRQRARDALATLISDHRILLKQERERLHDDLNSPEALANARDRAAIEPDATTRRYETASELGLFRALNFLERRRRSGAGDGGSVEGGGIESEERAAPGAFLAPIGPTSDEGADRVEPLPQAPAPSESAPAEPPVADTTTPPSPVVTPEPPTADGLPTTPPATVATPELPTAYCLPPTPPTPPVIPNEPKPTGTLTRRDTDSGPSASLPEPPMPPPDA